MGSGEAQSPASYALGHSQHELARLSRQGQAFLPFTRQLFEQAGIGPGMRVLDVGCGAGDVSFLAAELVGPRGEVLGMDQASAAIEWASACAASLKFHNVRFLQGDPVLMQFEPPFDAVVGRFVLMYYLDPVEAVRKLASQVRPGGLLVFQEFDMENFRAQPAAPTLERAAEWIKQTFRATGARIQAGMELYSAFLAAQLPAPSLRLDAIIGGGEDFPCELIAEGIRSLLPVMEAHGIASAGEVGLPTLLERIREEIVAANGVVVSPAVIGAWCRKAA